MTDTETVAERAASEMRYERGENSFGMETTASIPCQLRFVETPDQDTDEFHEALNEYGYSPIDTRPERDGVDPYYDGEIMTAEYERVKILVFRGAVVRIYPPEDGFGVAELADVIDALEQGFDAPLEHDPIDREETA